MMKNHHVPILRTLLFAAFVGLLACDRGPESTTSDSSSSAEEQARREEKAQVLFEEAAKAPPAQKIVLYRRIVTFFGETKVAPDSWRQLVLYLLHRTDDGQPAFEATTEYANAHPDDLHVGEAWRWLDNFAGVRDQVAFRKRIQAAWTAHMDKVRAGSGDRNLSDRARIWYDSGDVARRRREPAVARHFWEEAASWPIPEQHLRLVILWDLGLLLAQDPSLHDEARRTFEEALELAQNGVKGPRAETIEEQLRALGG